MFRRKVREAQIAADKAAADEARMVEAIRRSERLRVAREAAQAELNAVLGLRPESDGAA